MNPYHWLRKPGCYPLHHRLVHSFLRLRCTEREIRTLKKLLLRQLRLPFRHLCSCTCGGTRTHMCFAQQCLKLFCIPIPSHRYFALRKGIEPLSTARKAGVLAIRRTEHFLFGIQDLLCVPAMPFCGSYENRTRISRETVGEDRHYPNEPFCGSSRTRTYTLRRDQIYSLASQPIAQYFL